MFIQNKLFCEDANMVTLHWLLRKAFLSLLAILWNSAFKWIYLSYSSLLFASLLFTAICKASPDSHVAFLHFFSMGMVLIPVSCTSHEPHSIVHQALYLSDLGPQIYFSLPLYNHKGFDSPYLNGLAVFPTFFNLSLNLIIRNSWSEPQSAPGLVFVDCIELLHLWLQRI